MCLALCNTRDCGRESGTFGAIHRCKAPSVGTFWGLAWVTRATERLRSADAQADKKIEVGDAQDAPSEPAFKAQQAEVDDRGAATDGGEIAQEGKRRGGQEPATRAWITRLT